MARLFDGNDSLTIPTTGFLDSLSAATIMMRFKSTNEDRQQLMHYYKSKTDAFLLQINQPTLGLFTYVEHNDDKETLQGDPAIQITDGIWHYVHVTMSTGGSAHRLYYDGIEKAYTAADDQCFSTMDAGATLYVGVSMWGDIPGSFVDGSIAEIAIWNAVLSAPEILSTAKAFSPLLIRPQNLAHYWDLVRGLNDIIGGYVFTNDGSVVTPHPRVILPQGARY